jgi:hypothetical protein
MLDDRVREIIRQFQENGLKLLLTSPPNLSDLLTLARTAVLPRLDFASLTVDPTTYVTAEFRHVSSDLVLNLGLRATRKGGRKKRLMLTILLELQAQPDRLMMLRVLEYLVQIWKTQAKEHGHRYGSLASVKLTPILPIVFHTGSYSWGGLGSVLDLMDDAAAFHDVTPAFRPLFLSLPDVPEDDLESRGGYLGQVLALLKARKARREAFARRLERTVSKLAELRGPERHRRMELLSYVEALVYHAREGREHSTLRECIDESLRDDEARLEVSMVRRSMADIHREEGAIAAGKRTLLEQIQLRWGPPPAETQHAIQTTNDPDQLAQWLRAFATARDLDAVGIVPPR